MIDTATTGGRAAAAAMRLAEKRDWNAITLLEIADEAGLTLAELSRHVASKADVLAAFVRLVDDAVLRKTERGEPEESLRERLFDVLMLRLETLAPYRAGLKRISADGVLGAQLVAPVLRSQTWMLIAAGIPVEGVAGAARVAGLASVYGATFRDWLDDDDAGLARTMAGLDRRLRRGEGWIKSLDSVTATADQFGARMREMVGQALSRGRRGRDPGSAEPASPPPASPVPEGPGSGTAPGDILPGKPQPPVAPL